MDFKTIKAQIDDFVYKNSRKVYYILARMFAKTTIIPMVQCQVCGYIDSLKDVNSNGAIMFGEIYYYGFYVKKDHRKSIDMYNVAIAMDNNILAHYNIGFIYTHGDEKNIDIAIKHFTIAANGGCVSSQYALGVIYTTIDINKATEWYEIAAASKCDRSLSKLAELYINVDVMKSMNYYKLAIGQKLPNAKEAYDNILRDNKNFATINNLLNEINALKIQIEELELMPEGPKYKEAKEHFNLLAKSSGGLE
jgi:TPR repeat protein